MITPSPTTRLGPGLARGVLDGLDAPTATRPACVRVSIPNTGYVLHLVPAGAIASRPGARIVGTIRARVRRVDEVATGGRYIEPVIGRPRRVQGTIVSIDDAGNAIVVDAGVPMHCTLTDPRQRATQFEPGQLVAADVLDGATFEPRV